MCELVNLSKAVSFSDDRHFVCVCVNVNVCVSVYMHVCTLAFCHHSIFLMGAASTDTELNL